MASTQQSRRFIPLNIAVLTVSDSRTLDDDKSGLTLVERLAAAGHKLAERAIVRDDVDDIQKTVNGWIGRDDLDVVISTGGTGLTGRDVTVEAMRELFEKEIDGFSTAFHLVCWQKIGTSTVQSLSTAGVA